MYCVGCRGALSLEALDRTLRFPCPHCGVWLRFSPRDPYRGSANELVSVSCECGGGMRWTGGRGPGVFNGIWGVRSQDFGARLPPTVQRYQCEDCQRVVEE